MREVIKYFKDREYRLFSNMNAPAHLWLSINRMKWEYIKRGLK